MFHWTQDFRPSGCPWEQLNIQNLVTFWGMNSTSRTFRNWLSRAVFFAHAASNCAVFFCILLWREREKKWFLIFVPIVRGFETMLFESGGYDCKLEIRFPIVRSGSWVCPVQHHGSNIQNQKLRVFSWSSRADFLNKKRHYFRCRYPTGSPCNEWCYRDTAGRICLKHFYFSWIVNCTKPCQPTSEAIKRLRNKKKSGKHPTTKGTQPKEASHRFPAVTCPPGNIFPVNARKSANAIFCW